MSSARATLWVRTDGQRPLRIEYGPASGDAPAVIVRAAPEPARDRTARVALEALGPATRYAYEVSDGGEVVRGEFTTAPTPDADAPVRLLWSGDLGGTGYCREVEDGYRIFRTMAQRRPQLFVFVGDTIYADRPCGLRPHAPGGNFVAWTLADFHAKHRYNRADPLVQQFFRETAVYPVWDDHEVRNNFAGPDEPLMPVGRRAFFDYWPIEGPREEPLRLYRSVRWGRHVEIFILDTRQYRSSNWTADGPGKTMLGDEQREWLLGRVSASDATWKLIVSSVPLGMFTGGSASDSWSSANVLGFPRRTGTGFAYERDLVLNVLRERGVRNVVFLSGDVHHAELIRHEPAPGFVFHEFAAGPLAARPGYPLPLDRSLRSRSLGSLGWTHNFGEIVADGEALHVKILDTAGATRVALRLALDRGTAGPPSRASQ